MTTDTQTTHPTASSRPGLDLKVMLYGIIIFVLVGAGYLLYRNRLSTQRMEQQRTALLQTVRQNQLTSDRQQLTFGMKTFVWAVRNALLQNKAGEINEYFNTLVKDRGVKEVLLVDPTGKVVISTNKKNEGIQFSSRFPIYLLAEQDIYFNDKQPYELSAPVMAPNRRLGTLVMFYTPASILPDLSVSH